MSDPAHPTFTGLVPPGLFLSIVRGMSPRTPRSALSTYSTPGISPLLRSLQTSPANAELEDQVFSSVAHAEPDKLGPDEPLVLVTLSYLR